VTGHTGFKGSWLTYWLTLLGAEVSGLALDPDDGQQRLYSKVVDAFRLRADCRSDIRDASAVLNAIVESQPNFIFHLAAQPLVRRSYEEPAATFEINVQGLVNLLEAVRKLGRPCVVVIATTDKCYENKNWVYGYREDDSLGGHDPYSASKACAEIVTAAYRRSFFAGDHRIKLATARAGNVIGGGDWSRDRIVPDCLRALRRGEAIPVRNKTATRPWQHVLEPLSGYLTLAAAMTASEGQGLDATRFCDSFNFGPLATAERSVAELVEHLLRHIPGAWRDASNPTAVHEAARLSLAIDKANHVLGWRPVWDFSETVRRTAEWYQADERGDDLARVTRSQIEDYVTSAKVAGLPWALTP
jgi:CDP-glucose 4,6-dehydratase